MKILSSIIEASKQEGGASLDIFKLTKNGCIMSFFSLHDFVELRELEEKWLR